jgi:hypothetical protein
MTKAFCQYAAVWLDFYFVRLYIVFIISAYCSFVVLLSRIHTMHRSCCFVSPLTSKLKFLGGHDCRVFVSHFSTF